ncbi:M1 family metallopeptidase [Shewanella aestuarii]|uniref:Aminopeptidase N n=1 Tax=Shewanella aestuarii TaxID=1028752 RepID=A0A6G9QJJ5_9GAMM|nr:M1 family metallopeptidase [Shewanella aestuarii]QIR14049.1 M1 family metallopeptidase [Shewanella aestuarii]
MLRSTSSWDNTHDYHSSANTDDIRVNHFKLNLFVDFDQQCLSGEVTLQFFRVRSDQSKINEGVSKLIVDCRDLIIFGVTDVQGNPLKSEVIAVNDTLGQKLVIAIDDQINAVTIQYKTSVHAQGLQWLTPQQTLGKQQPYLFSQSQPINARSWIPLQDTPKARVTFDAQITVTNGLRAVMSAPNNPQMPVDGMFVFNMDKPIPTHLLALAVGDLAFEATGPRSGIYTEPGMLAKAVKEFEDTEEMILVAESLLGPYLWGRYDMIVLPPSFPFGGMENPMLAFMTPTLIAGDKSLVSTVAHELAHSWTGNLVSNATWRDLWLNEGFTTYFTNRIVEAVYGKEQADIEWVNEYNRLQAEMQSTDLVDQTLPANVQTRDPNLAFNRFTYDKASMFVHELELRLGREVFDQFLFNYVKHFAFKAITTETFLAYMQQTLLTQHSDKLSEAELMEWLYGQGLPQWFTPPSSNSLDKVELALSAFEQGCQANELNVSDWSVHDWQYFLNKLPQVIKQAQLMDLDEHFQLSQSQNAEIACDWFRVAVRNHYDPVLPNLSEFLTTVGRTKFVKPLYTELLLAGYSQEVRDIYCAAREGYHPSLQVQLDKILN